MDAKEVIDICLRKRVNWSLVHNGSRLNVKILGCDIYFSKSKAKSKHGFTEDEIEIMCQCYLNDFSYRLRLRFDKYCDDYKILENSYNQAIKKAENRIK